LSVLDRRFFFAQPFARVAVSSPFIFCSTEFLAFFPTLRFAAKDPPKKNVSLSFPPPLSSLFPRLLPCRARHDHGETQCQRQVVFPRRTFTFKSILFLVFFVPLLPFPQFFSWVFSLAGECKLQSFAVRVTNRSFPNGVSTCSESEPWTSCQIIQKAEFPASFTGCLLCFRSEDGRSKKRYSLFREDIPSVL